MGEVHISEERGGWGEGEVGGMRERFRTIRSVLPMLLVYLRWLKRTIDWQMKECFSTVMACAHV